MTTPEGSGAAKGASGRVKRKPPARSGPDRSGASSRPPADPKPADPADVTIDDAIADSVKTAYSVLSETIEQGRRSAESFRHGDYNYREIPVDIRQLAANLLKLARQLSTSTFEICEALLSQQFPGFPPPPGHDGSIPPFRDPAEKPKAGQHPHKPHTGAAAKPAAAGMRLTVNFAGCDGAVAHVHALARPAAATTPGEIFASSLVSRDGKASFSGVSFDADLAHGGLIATVTVPAGQAPGVYSSAVYAPGQDLPLGQLVIELPAATPGAGG